MTDTKISGIKSCKQCKIALMTLLQIYLNIGVALKDSGNNSSRFFVSQFHLFHNFVIFNWYWLQISCSGRQQYYFWFATIMMTNNEQWMNNDILETKINEIFFFKKSNKKISKKKLFSWEILSLTWHVISMLDNPLTEYSYHWNFYLRQMFNISIFFSQTNGIQCAKKVIFD